MSYKVGISQGVWNCAALFLYEFSEEVYNQPAGSIDSLSWFIERSPGATQEDFNNFSQLIDNVVYSLKQKPELCLTTLD